MGKLPPGVCYVLKPPPGYHYEWVSQSPVQVRESDLVPGSPAWEKAVDALPCSQSPRGLPSERPVGAGYCVDQKATTRAVKPTPVAESKPKPKPQVRSVLPSQSTLGFLRAECDWMKQQPTETTAIFSLNASGDVCGCTRIQGTSNRCDIEVGHVVREAVTHQAVSTVILHNHPSKMAAEPSTGDDQATDELRRALEAASIGLTDHCIIAKSGHVHSYREANMEPEPLWERRERESRRLWAPFGGTNPYAIGAR